MNGFYHFHLSNSLLYDYTLYIVPSFRKVSRNLAFLQYKFYDMNGEELDMKEEFEIK